MFISDCLSVNSDGHLTIGGVDTVELAQKYGTPLYVLDENKIRSNCAKFRNALEKYYKGNAMCLYASKALCCKELCRIVADEGLGIDVVSGGEIYTAFSAGFPMEKVHFHGNNKTEDEIVLALKTGVGCFVVDNLNELNMLSDLSAKANKISNVLLRIKPGIDAHTHDYVRTGQIDSKFGFALETGEAYDAVVAASKAQSIRLAGLHCHIASQVFEVAPYVEAAEVMMNFIAKLNAEQGIIVEQLDLGGGFGVRYVDKDDQVSYLDFMEPVSAVINNICQQNSLKAPMIFIEPGRSIVADAGITLYTVGNVKNIPDIRTYVSIDGGMGDNPRYILYQADYTIECANKADKPKDMIITLAGKCCESGDLIQENAPIQTLDAGDIVAVLNTGAYNYSMASNYNRIPRPAVVMVSNGEPREIVRRETWQDVVSLDV